MGVLEGRDLVKSFVVGRRRVEAVRGVSLDIDVGETLALVGESGSGKSTTGRLCLGLLHPDGGSVRVLGRDLSELRARQLRSFRGTATMVFQEPFQSLNPRMRVGSIIEEPLQIHQPELESRARSRKVNEALEQVGLPTGFAQRFPAELSGGQQQRVGIARAVICKPRFVVLDEPTSSLDLSVQAQILRLLRQLQTELDLAYLFISHDLHTVRYVADRVAVMHHGRIVETGRTEAVFTSPERDYTKSLLAATLSPHRFDALPGATSEQDREPT